MRPTDYKTKEQALAYEHYRFSNGLKTVAKNEENLIIKWLSKVENINEYICIDLASGTGRGLNLLLKAKVKKIYAIDQSDAMLSFIREKFKREVKQNRISLLNDSSNNFKIALGSIDLVLSLHLFKHLPNIIPTLTQINKSLKPNGLLVFDVLNKNSIIFSNLDTCYALSKEDIISKLTSAGFRTEKIISMHILGETIYKYLPWGTKHIFNFVDHIISSYLPFSTKFFILARKK